MFIKAIFLTLAITTATAATAVPTVYTSEAAFNAAIANATGHAFRFADGTSLGTTYVLGPVSFAVNEALFGFADAYGTSYLGGFGDLRIDAATVAVGLHFGSYNGDQTVTYTVGGITGTFVAPAPDSTTFIGFVDVTPVSVTFSNVRELDTISFTTGDQLPAVVAVPEPASWALLVGGFGVVGGIARRRRPAVAA